MIDLDCRFCNPPDQNRILFESENYYIMLSLGPIVEGYLLLVSKQHDECCAALPEKHSAEFDRLYTWIKEILTDTYGHAIAYEHGRAGSCLVASDSKHCYHAHMHFVPIQFDMNSIVSEKYPGTVQEDLTAFRKAFHGGHNSYLFVDDGQMKMYKPTDEVPRQYLRTVTASYMKNDSSWDWLAYKNWPLINAGIEKLKSIFDQNAINQ